MRIHIEYKLYEVRREKGYTVRSLSQISGVSKTNINDIEDQKANPSVRVICMLAVALGSDPCDLFKIK
jgi:transcriptional regulator with XRE-family HTH domain